MDNQAEWTPWVPPYDPRRLEGTDVMEDEHGRLIHYASCSVTCPGCGVCCAGYRDVIAPDYDGIEEFEGNQKMGGLVKLQDGALYRVPRCGEGCPGFERCCPPYDLRNRPESVADARHILLESETAALWAMHEALLILAHDGNAEAVKVLEAYMSRAHTRVAGLAECALEEGRYFATIPRSPEEAHNKMKREVLEEWDQRAVDAYGEIEEIEAELERRQYEVEIARRLLDRAPDDAARETWQSQVEVLETLLGQAERRLTQRQQGMDVCDAMVAEMQADLGIDPMEDGRGIENGELPF
jgi:hypothetical protein